MEQGEGEQEMTNGLAHTYVSFSALFNTKNVENLMGMFTTILQRGATEVTLILSSTGGTVDDGLAAYTQLQALNIQLSTYNPSNIGSIANIVFLAGSQRSAAPWGTFYFHGVGRTYPQDTFLTEVETIKSIEGMRRDTGRLTNILQSRTGLTGEDIATLYASAEGRTVDCDFALSKGIIDKTEKLSIPGGCPIFHVPTP
jgi:ATP-dependent protease ClpP protease subunit